MIRNSAIRISILVLILALWHSSLGAAATNAPSQLPSDDYKELKYTNHSGDRMKLRGHRNFRVEWVKDMKAANDLAMNREQTRIYVANANAVVAFSLTGKVLWKRALPALTDGDYSLHVGEDDTVYALGQVNWFPIFAERSPWQIVALSPAGKVLWNRTIESYFGSVTYYGDNNGTLVFNTADGIEAIRNGQTVWTNDEIQQPFRLSDDYDLVFSNLLQMYSDGKGTTFIQTRDGVHALDPEGKSKWSLEGRINSYDPVQNGKYLLGISSREEWKLLDSETGGELSSSLINPLWLKETGWATDGQGAYYSNNFTPEDRNGISKIDAKGRVLWSYRLRFPGYAEVSSPQSDPAGNVYFSDNGGRVYSLDPRGNERFMLVYLSGSRTKMTIDQAGNVYALIQGTGLFKISTVQP